MGGTGMMVDNREEEEEEDDLKGTTAIAFFNEDYIFAAVDSRKSNEWMPMCERKPNWCPKISDTAEKAKIITEKILAIKVGNSDQCDKLMDHVDIELDHLKLSGKEITVSYVADVIEKYLSTCGKARAFGTLLAGHDETNGLQVYRLFMEGGIVVRETADEIASMGTGSGFANHLAVHCLGRKLSLDDGRKFSIKMVLNGLFFDKNSGGVIHTFLITKERFFDTEPCDSLTAYWDYFEQYDPSKMFFLIYDVKDTKLLGTDDFINHFSSGGDIIVAHRVDERVSDGFNFFFHRLVFTCQEEAKNALRFSKVKKYNSTASDPPIFSYFGCTTILDGGDKIGKVTMRIGRASKKTVEFMLTNCPIRNAAVKRI